MNADAGYFWRRAEQELFAAGAAGNPVLRAAHLRLALHYRLLADSVATHHRRLSGRRTRSG